MLLNFGYDAFMVDLDVFVARNPWPALRAHLGFEHRIQELSAADIAAGHDQTELAAQHPSSTAAQLVSNLSQHAEETRSESGARSGPFRAPADDSQVLVSIPEAETTGPHHRLLGNRLCLRWYRPLARLLVAPGPYC